MPLFDTSNGVFSSRRYSGLSIVVVFKFDPLLINMSILQPGARQFIVVGSSLKDRLDQHDLFKRYFSDKEDRIKVVDDLHKFNIEHYRDLEHTLFIVRSFDVDENTKSNDVKNNDNNHRPTGFDGDTMSTTPSRLHTSTPNGINNNHLTKPMFNCSGINESEAESVGYTTDFDEEESMPPPPAPRLVGESTNLDDAEAFTLLMKHKCSIMGPIALLQSIRNLGSCDESIRMIPHERPLHNLAMLNTLITFSGISDKKEAQLLLTLTRYMGAKSREDVTNKTTHLVAGNPRGLKYRRALELGLSIMSTEWVRESFRLAQIDLDFEATMPEIIQHYKLKPFHGLQMAFVGFSEEDVKELSELTVANEGTVADTADICCSHIIVDAISGFDDTNTQLLSSINQNSQAHIVYKEWFWASLEMEGKASEDAYAVPGFKSQTRRSSRARRTSTGFNSFSNILSPMLDYSRSPDSISNILDTSRQASRAQSVSCIAEEEQDLSKITARHRASLELMQTERNYVKILETIVNLFKLPLENPDQSDPILPSTDVKIIFGNLTPIYEVHKRMLGNLSELIENHWTETNCIGKVFVAHSIELLRAYPPFVNFFEDTKKTINTCDQKYPRFHAFLKRCQSKIECNRESLTEMLIRPVQRLPSISLILTELIKRTEDTNPDKKYLMEALESIKRVMNLINEDKRKTEGQIAMFDIVNNIEDCPPNLLSSMRRLICKVEARLIYTANDVPNRSHKIVLFLFSDLIEICKIRSLKRSHSYKNNKNIVPIRRGLNRAPINRNSSTKKEYRHLDELRLCDVMNIYKKCQSPEMCDAFVVQARPNNRYDNNFRYYPILIDDESMNTATFIEKLENCLCTYDDPEQVSEYIPNNDLKPITNEEIDFNFANSLVHSMAKTALSRVLSIRQSLLSPSLKSQRNHHQHPNHN